MKVTFPCKCAFTKKCSKVVPGFWAPFIDYRDTRILKDSSQPSWSCHPVTLLSSIQRKDKKWVGNSLSYKDKTMNEVSVSLGSTKVMS